MEPGRGLTRREFEEVIRRATEMAAADADTSEHGLDESELFRIARDVGLSERHVRRALAEVRATPPAAGPLDRLVGPAVVRASRVVPGEPAPISALLDEFLVAGQLLQAVRRGPAVLVYRPAVDWASQIARAASSTSGRYYVASAKLVEIRLRAVGPDSTLVDMEVDPGTRNDHLAGVFLGGGAAGVAAGVGLTALVAGAAPLAMAAVAGVAAGGGVGSGVAWLVGRSHQRRLREVRLEMEGVLDRLEAGDSLEPPPPSWRRWVKRHFHGVAREVLGDPDGMTS